MASVKTSNSGTAGVKAPAGRLFPAAVVAVLGIGISLAAFAVTYQWDEGRLRYELDNRTASYGKVLAHIPEMYIDELQSIGALYAATKVVDRREFRIFAQTILEHYPGIQALEWIPRVSAVERAAYEKAARKDGFPGCQFKEVSGDGEMVAAGPPRRVSGRRRDLRTNGPARVRIGRGSGPAILRPGNGPPVSGAMITEVTDGHRAVGRLGFQGFDPAVFTRPGNMGSHFA